MYLDVNTDNFSLRSKYDTEYKANCLEVVVAKSHGDLFPESGIEFLLRNW